MYYKPLLSDKNKYTKKGCKYNFYLLPLILKEELFFSNLHPLGMRQNKLMKSNSTNEIK